MSEAGYIASCSGRSSSDSVESCPVTKKKRTLKSRKRGCRSPPTTPSTSPTNSLTTNRPVYPITEEGGLLPSGANYQMMVAQMGSRMVPCDQGLSSSDSEGTEAYMRFQHDLPVPEARFLVDPVSDTTIIC